MDGLARLEGKQSAGLSSFPPRKESTAQDNLYKKSQSCCVHYVVFSTALVVTRNNAMFPPNEFFREFEDLQGKAKHINKTKFPKA